MEQLLGKRALVTGAASGIGRETVLGLAREGVDLLLVDVDDEGLGAVAKEAEAYGVEAHTFEVDVSGWEQVRDMAETVHTRWGPLDILVNNAGIALSRELVYTSIDEWKRVIGVNLWGPVHFVHAFVPEMMRNKKGHIVNVSSGQVFFAAPCWGAYAATKFAIDGFSDALRYECRRHGVGVTTVYPAIVATRFYDEVEGNFWTRLGLRLLPLVATKPEKLGRKIVKAIKKNRRRELVHPVVYGAFYLAGLVDFGKELLGRVVAYLICRREE